MVFKVLMHAFLIVALLLVACRHVDTSEYTRIAEEIRMQFAPDKRTVLFDIGVDHRKGEVIIRGQTTSPDGKAALLDSLEAGGYQFVDSIMVLPDPVLPGTKGVVRLSVCNIRTMPKHAAELATQATLGTPLKVWKKQGTWYYVQTPDQYLGWLDADGFTLMEDRAYRVWENAEKVIFTGQTGYVYRDPSEEGGKISDLLAGNILVAAGPGSEDMIAVRFPDGRRGYVPGNQVIDYPAFLSGKAGNGSEIIQTAKGYLGTPYLWGGTSGKAFDCSGFTKTVFFLHGMLLPRDASQQVLVGEELGVKLDTGQWRAGDLLFFGRHATAQSRERITHVAIYMGAGEMIHAAGRVRIESLVPGTPNFAQHRYDTFVRAKRILDTPSASVLHLSNQAAYSRM